MMSTNSLAAGWRAHLGVWAAFGLLATGMWRAAAVPFFPAEVNDAFANAVGIFHVPFAGVGSTVGGTKEPGEPNHAGNAGGASVWWRWTAFESGPVEIDLTGSDFDTLLAVYHGNELSALTLEASDDDSGDGNASRLEFAAEAGVEYWIAIDGYGGAAGQYVVSLALGGARPGNDDFEAAFIISAGTMSVQGQTLAATREDLEPMHAGNGGGGSVWWRWTAPLSGPITLNTEGSHFDTLLAVYEGSSMEELRLIAADDDSGEGSASRLTFSATAGMEYRIAVDGYNGARGNYVLNLAGFLPRPANDDFASRFLIEGTQASVAGNNTGASVEPGEPPLGGGRSIWWTWTAPANGPFSADTSGSIFDTILAIYTGESVGALDRVGMDGDQGANGSGRINFFARAGTAYHFAVDGQSGGSGDMTLNLAPFEPAQPNDFFEERSSVPHLATRVFGSNAGSTSQGEEPSTTGGGHRKSVWWTWTAPRGGTATFTTEGSSFDTVLAVYTGVLGVDLALIAIDDDSASGLASAIAFQATAGERYQIQVGGYNGAEGAITLETPSLYAEFRLRELWVTSFNNNRILRFEEATGLYLGDAALGGAIQFPQMFDLDGAGHLLVASAFGNEVLQFGAISGVYERTLIPNGRGGLNNAIGLAFDPNGRIFVGSWSNSQVLAFDLAGTFQGIVAEAGRPEGFVGGNDVKIGLNGYLYLSSYGDQTVKVVDPGTGALILSTESGAAHGIQNLTSLALTQEGSILAVDSRPGGAVHRFDGTTGAYLGVAVSAGAGGLVFPQGLEAGGSFLYVADVSRGLMRFNAASGAFIDLFIPMGTAGLSGLGWVKLIERQPPPRVDLVPRNFSASQAGTTVTLYWADANLGDLSTEGVAYFHSVEVSWVAGGQVIHQQVASVPNPDENGVLPHEEKSRSLTFELPAGVTEGAELRAAVTVDSKNHFAESNATGTGESNNRDSFEFSIFRPDLRIVEAQYPRHVLAGQRARIRWTTVNWSSVEIQGSWSESIFVSRDPQGNDAQLLHTSISGGPLPGGHPRFSEFEATIPVELPPGFYYLIIKTDSLNQVAEGSREGNNVFTSDPIQVDNQDLAVQNFSASAATVAFGGSLPVSWGVRNVGTAPIDVDWVDRVYLSAAADSIAGAVLLSIQSHETGLPAGESYSRAPTLALPAYANQPLGTYYLILLGDADGDVTESSENNNRAVLSVTLTAPPSPDLRVRTVIVPAVEMLPGQPGELQWTLENVGNAPAPGPWTETIYISVDGLIGGDIVAGTVTFDEPLAPGASVQRTGQFTIPFNGPLGNVYLVVRTDSDGAVVEQNESNNAEISVIPVAVPAILQLEIPVAQIAENAPNQVVQAVVSRSGPTLGVLQITATSTDPSEAAVPASVTILSGQASAILPVTVQKDGVVDGPQPVAVSVSAAGFQATSVALTVLDSDVPKLTMAIAPGALSEGQTATGTITRDYVTSSPLTVNLATTGSSDLQLPPSVVILGDLAEVTFSIVAVDDDLTESLETHSIAISAVGFVGAAASISIAANDDAEIQLTSDRAAISEGDGPQAARLTVSRMAVTSQPLTIQLESSDATAAQVPRTVAIPAFKASASVPVAAVDDELVDGAQPVQISARAMTPAGEPGSSANPLLIQVEDDDGPTLKFTVTPGIVPEDRPAAAIGRVSRNTSTAQALLVALVRDALGEVSLPALVIIPAGSVYVEFPIDTLEDGVPDGDQRVTLTALADGYTSGTAVIIVTDENRPDLTISGITVPAAGVAEGSISVTYRISNEGLLAAAGPFWQRVFLSRDSLLGDDILLNQFSFGGELPPGLHIDQTVQVTLPLEPGDYWLVVATDAEDAIHETREDNNAAVSLAKIPVGNAYSARVEAAFETALSGTPVPLSGEAVLAESGLPARFVSVHIHILLRDTERILAAITDGNGQFSTTFQPLAGEGGRYRIGAAHPGRRTVEVQDEFTLIGLRFDPANLSVTLVEGNTGLATAALRNLSDIPLSGLAASVVENPVGLAVAAQLGSSSLPGLGEAGLTLQFGTAPATPNSARVVIRVTSNEGAQADLPVEIVLEPLKPRLVADPSSLSRGMLRGQQTSYEFEVVNRGGAPSGPVTLLLPDFPWLRVASENPLPSLPPGGSGRVALLLSPAADLPLIQYGGTLVLRAALHSLAIPFQFRAVSEAKGNLEVIAEDEFTYFAEGSPHVAGAAVSVFDAVSGDQVAAGLTDADGRFAAADLPEGYYRVEATAERHNGFRANIQITAGDTKVVRAFMARQTVRYIWTVEEIQIEDRTQIHIETVFETFVPAPVIVVDPIYVDLSPLTSPGQKMQVNYKIANHGLIAAQNGKFRFSEHPLYRITPLIENVGTIPANSEMTVPVTIERLGGDSVLRALSLSCNPNGSLDHSVKCLNQDRFSSTGLVFGGAPGCGRDPEPPRNNPPDDTPPGVTWSYSPIDLAGPTCRCDDVCLDPGSMVADESNTKDIHTCVGTDLVFEAPPVRHTGARIKTICPDGTTEEKTIYGTPEEPAWTITRPHPELPVKGTGRIASVLARLPGSYRCEFRFQKLAEPIFDELPCQPSPITIQMKGNAGEIRLTRPEGDPAKNPMFSGDGQNRFIFDMQSPGNLITDFAAEPCPNLAPERLADLTDKVYFEVVPLESTPPVWIGEPGGKAKYERGQWTAAAKFVGLPTQNNSFGRKEVVLKAEGEAIEIRGYYEIFYLAQEKNHPGPNSAEPNWFYYYKQAEGGSDYSYDPLLSGSNGRTDTTSPYSIVIGPGVFTGNQYVVTAKDQTGILRAVGVSQTYSYLPSFFATVHHERAHRMVFSSQANGNSNDSDNDGLDDSFEISIGSIPAGEFYESYFSINGGQANPQSQLQPAQGAHVQDGDLYAAGPAEQAGYLRGTREAKNKDWAIPGTKLP